MEIDFSIGNIPAKLNRGWLFGGMKLVTPTESVWLQHPLQLSTHFSLRVDRSWQLMQAQSDPSYPFFRFNVDARAFLARAEQHLDLFERDATVANFFYSALELRFGIEARLNEYLRSALKSIGKDSEDIFEYVGSKLLKRLTAIDPDAERPSVLRITCEQDGSSTALRFTPVTQRLASIHGQLGGLLHYKFFTTNTNWVIRKPLGGQPHRSVPDFLPLLKEGIEELRLATSGNLLSNPRFESIVQAVAEDGETGGKNEG